MNPFNPDPAQCVSSLSEPALIARVRQWLGQAAPPAPHGMGDDCSVLPVGSVERPLLTVDAVHYRKHFDDSCPPEAVGAKLLKRNLSDIAAMGGQPVAAVLALNMGADVSLRWLEGFYRGLAQASLLYECPIVGGDVSGDDAGRFGASLTLLGQAPERTMLREQAAKGASLWVTGALGGSLGAGQKHLYFEPRLREGAWLSQYGGVLGVMDVSDGLGSDMARFLGKGFCAYLDVQALPLAEAIRAQADAPTRALCDGEDYELLFALEAGADKSTFAAAFAAAFETALTCIGTVRDEDTQAGVALRDAATGQPLVGQGFLHF